MFTILLDKLATSGAGIDTFFGRDADAAGIADNSKLLNNLQFAPYLLGLFIFLYLMFSFWFMRTIKKTDEGFLWAGLAKETAKKKLPKKRDGYIRKNNKPF